MVTNYRNLTYLLRKETMCQVKAETLKVLRTNRRRRKSTLMRVPVQRNDGHE